MGKKKTNPSYSSPNTSLEGCFTTWEGCSLPNIGQEGCSLSNADQERCLLLVARWVGMHCGGVGNWESKLYPSLKEMNSWLSKLRRGVRTSNGNRIGLIGLWERAHRYQPRPRSRTHNTIVDIIWVSRSKFEKIREIYIKLCLAIFLPKYPNLIKLNNIYLNLV